MMRSEGEAKNCIPCKFALVNKFYYLKQPTGRIRERCNTEMDDSSYSTANRCKEVRDYEIHQRKFQGQCPKRSDQQVLLSALENVFYVHDMAAKDPLVELSGAMS